MHDVGGMAGDHSSQQEIHEQRSLIRMIVEQ